MRSYGGLSMKKGAPSGKLSCYLLNKPVCPCSLICVLYVSSICVYIHLCLPLSDSVPGMDKGVLGNGEKLKVNFLSC